MEYFKNPNSYAECLNFSNYARMHIPEVTPSHSMSFCRLLSFPAALFPQSYINPDNWNKRKYI